MTFIIFALVVLSLLIKKKNVIWVFNVATIWLSPVVALWETSLIGLIQKFVILFFILTKWIKVSNYVDRQVLLFFLTLFLLYIPTLFLSSGSVVMNLLAFRSQLYVWLFVLVIWNIDYGEGVLKKSAPFVAMSVLLLCLYGFYSYYSSSNYYYEFWSDNLIPTNRVDEDVDGALLNTRAGLKGRITGTAQFTIQYGILIAIEVYYLLGLYKKYLTNVVLFTLLILLCFNIYFTGSRGPIMALIASLIFYLFKELERKTKIIILALLLISLSMGVTFIDNLIELFISSDDTGSNMEMRFGQLAGAIGIISDSSQSLFFGKGLYWVSDYLSKNGGHPLCLWFESVILSGLVGYGLYGIVFIFGGEFLLLFLIIRKFRKKRYLDKDSYYVLLSLLFAKFIYNLFVGEGYLYLFYLVFFMVIKISVERCKTIKTKYRVDEKD